MPKTRVVVPGTIGRSLRIPAVGTSGATLGQDLRMPDGSTATAAALRAYLGVQQPKGSTAAAGPPWRCGD